MVVRVKDEPQLGLEEKRLETVGLEETIGRMVDLVESVREYRDLRAQIKEVVRSMPEGEYRVGPYLLIVQERSGGGFGIKEWTAKTFRVKAS